MYILQYIPSWIEILAGVWPCGVIVFIAELFVTESKAQVYGILHNLCQSCQNLLRIFVSNTYKFVHAANSNAFKLNFDIGCLCYDDACHLRKYAIQPLWCPGLSHSNVLCSQSSHCTWETRGTNHGADRFGHWVGLTATALLCPQLLNWGSHHSSAGWLGGSYCSDTGKMVKPGGSYIHQASKWCRCP